MPAGYVQEFPDLMVCTQGNTILLHTSSYGENRRMYTKGKYAHLSQCGSGEARCGHGTGRPGTGLPHEWGILIRDFNEQGEGYCRTRFVVPAKLEDWTSNT